MKSLRGGELIKGTFTINCKFGESVLYISNLGIMIESINGIMLDLDYNSILSFQQFDKMIIKIIWRENDRMFDFIFKYKKPTELTDTYRITYEDYRNSKDTNTTQEQTEQITIKNPVLEL